MPWNIFHRKGAKAASPAPAAAPPKETMSERVEHWRKIFASEAPTASARAFEERVEAAREEAARERSMDEIARAVARSGAWYPGEGEGAAPGTLGRPRWWPKNVWPW